MLEANRYRRKSIVKKPILYLHLYKSIDICSFIQIRIHIVYIKADQCEIHGVPIISRGLFLETKIDDPKNWRVSSSPSYFGSWLAEIAPRGWQCGFNVVLPWPSSLSLPSSPSLLLPFPIPDRKVTAAPVAFHPHSLSPPHPYITIISSPSSSLHVSRTLAYYLSPSSICTHVRRHAFSRVTLSPSFTESSSRFSDYPSENLQSCNSVITPTHAGCFNHLRDLEWNRGNVTVTIYNYCTRIPLG